MKSVMIISDATGETAERMVRAATLQFSEPVQIKLFSRVRLESELEHSKVDSSADRDWEARYRSAIEEVQVFKKKVKELEGELQAAKENVGVAVATAEPVPPREATR